MKVLLATLMAVMCFILWGVVLAAMIAQVGTPHGGIGPAVTVTAQP